MLSALPGRCVVLTNGSKEYARRVPAALGVAERMEEINGIECMGYIAKPAPYPYRKLLRAAGARRRGHAGGVVQAARRHNRRVRTAERAPRFSRPRKSIRLNRNTGTANRK